ncbi:MAG: hypothetical protein M0Z59_05065 [Nitrospiraceae bacterium]|nr:hypothetical protein [Nitrospiraceae bacterium]
MVAYEDDGNSKGILMLILGPFVGLAYVIAMPFIAIGTTAALLAGKAFHGLAGLIRNVVSFGWRPSESYLAGKKKGKK